MIEGIADGLVGQDPMQMNRQDLPFPYCREYDGFELAIFDLVGKKLGVPVYQLLGGAYRDRVLVSTLHVHLPYVNQGQSMHDAVRAIQTEAVDYFNFGGGLVNFRRLAALADAADMPYWHGSEVDLGILEAGYLHAAASARNCTLPSDIFGESIRENDLVLEPLEYDGQSHLVVPQGPGLGVELDIEAVNRYRVDDVA